ncbi:hypothetical protein RA267_28765, partial [Pseudomonas syringae pv. tagetis]|uniref:hypothetical protein n=1 Tax=Pseudomonas syringae group genomosp. 7 TaxID=251699 RepID=UPI00376F767C
GLKHTPHGLTRLRVERLRMAMYDTYQPIDDTIRRHRVKALLPKPWANPPWFAKRRQAYRFALKGMRIRLDRRQQDFSHTQA